MRPPRRRSRPAPSPTSTTPVPPGWTTPTAPSTRPWPPPTAGPRTYPTMMSWSGCSRSTRDGPRPVGSRREALVPSGASLRMATSARAFRTPESIRAELVTRDQVPSFLESRGFSNLTEQRTERGSSITQIVRACDHLGSDLQIHVRICWRRDGRNPREKSYSAAQLRARTQAGRMGGNCRFYRSPGRTSR